MTFIMLKGKFMGIDSTIMVIKLIDPPINQHTDILKSFPCHWHMNIRVSNSFPIIPQILNGKRAEDETSTPKRLDPSMMAHLVHLVKICVCGFLTFGFGLWVAAEIAAGSVRASRSVREL